MKEFDCVNDGFGFRHGSRVQFEQSVHALPVLLGQYPDATHYPAPGLEIVFLSMRRTVSRLTLPMLGSWRAARSSSVIVQRWRPTGGVERAKAVTRASALVSYWRGRPERSTSNSTKSNPPCKYARRARHTATASTGCGSPIPPYTPLPRSGDVAQVRRTVKNSNPGDISR